MIEWNHNENGELWVRADGRALCSARDPIKEANQWCLAQGALDLFKEVRVVGIGAGYHLCALQNRFPRLRIEAFDSKHQLQNEMPSVIRERLSEMILHWGNQGRDELFKSLPRGPVLRFPMACGSAEERVYRQLRGQDPESFLYWCGQQRFESLEETVHGLPVELAIQIKTLKSSSPVTEEGRLLKVLQELVR